MKKCKRSNINIDIFFIFIKKHCLTVKNNNTQDLNDTEIVEQVINELYKDPDISKLEFVFNILGKEYINSKILEEYNNL
jgi:hypothetical protein